jgi:hypothetical protein
MDNFLRLYAIYRTVPRWKVGVGIYKEAPKRLKLQLWVAKALFLIFAVLQYYLPTEEFYFFITIVAACVWGMSFHKSIKIVFACEYEMYPEQMKYFGRDYQYLRYLQFKEKIIGVINKQSIEETIRFVFRAFRCRYQAPGIISPSSHILVGSRVSNSRNSLW